ncbi:MAG: hypothetical protein ACR2O2_00490 [Ruegeria sp.]
MAVQFVLSGGVITYLDCSYRCEVIFIETINLTLVVSGVVAGIVYTVLTRVVYGHWPRALGIVSGLLIAMVLTSKLARFAATKIFAGEWAILIVVLVVLTLGYGWLKLFGSIPPKTNPQVPKTNMESIAR